MVAEKDEKLSRAIDYVKECLTTYKKAIAGLMVVFAIGLVMFFIFSAPYGDGLEVTMEKAGLEEPEPAYQAPLDYGETYPVAFVMGLVGAAVVLVVFVTASTFLSARDEGEKAAANTGSEKE